jgi:hypothetical protein
LKVKEVEGEGRKLKEKKLKERKLKERKLTTHHPLRFETPPRSPSP